MEPWERVLEDIEAALREADRVSDLGVDAAVDFATGVTSTLESIRDSVGEDEFATVGQAMAVKNILGALKRWRG